MDGMTGLSTLELWRLALAVGVFMVSAFCTHLLLLPGPNRQVRLPLGLFFLANTLRLVALPVEHMTGAASVSLLNVALELAEVPLSMVQPVLLWLYVRRLTADPTRPDGPVRRWAHGAPIVASCAIYGFVVAQQGWLIAGAGLAETLQPVSIALLWAVTVIFYTLVPVYAVLTIRRLLSYKTQLKDLYASTEGRELRWIWGIMAAVSFFWLFNLISILFEAAGAGDEVLTPAVSFYAGASAQIALLWIIAIWGVRQQPGMTPPATAPEDDNPPPAPTRKYGHSAQDGAHLARIAAKIERVMSEEKLYQEPDLSLWDLADRVGAKRHYVSQALNERLGQSFFDYVNGLRIEDAKRQLVDTDGSILTITYDVGFNSRSVFYRAFKQNVGVTPSAYRQGVGLAMPPGGLPEQSA